eukprot:4564227-Alexandrium_andersonii.AAC.1
MAPRAAALTILANLIKMEGTCPNSRRLPKMPGAGQKATSHTTSNSNRENAGWKVCRHRRPRRNEATPRLGPAPSRCLSKGATHLGPPPRSLVSRGEGA